MPQISALAYRVPWPTIGSILDSIAAQAQASIDNTSHIIDFGLVCLFFAFA